MGHITRPNTNTTLTRRPGQIDSITLADRINKAARLPDVPPSNKKYKAVIDNNWRVRYVDITPPRSTQLNFITENKVTLVGRIINFIKKFKP